jgi:hypothetical protein
MNKSYFNKEIPKPYLRLNEYLTSILIIHSHKHKKNNTEIDLIVFIFSYYDQQDRVVECCDYLQIPQNTSRNYKGIIPTF